MNVVFPRMVGRTDGRSVVWDRLEVACQSRHRKRERSHFRQFRPNEKQATSQKKPTFVEIVRLVDTRRPRDPDPIDDDAPRMPQVVDFRCQPASVVPTKTTAKTSPTSASHGDSGHGTKPDDRLTIPTCTTCIRGSPR